MTTVRRLFLSLALLLCGHAQSDSSLRRRATELAVYDLPPFAISFESPNRWSGDKHIDAALLASSVGVPLKIVVRQFLYETWSQQLALAVEPVPDILYQFQRLELQVSVYSPQAQWDEGMARRVLSSDDLLQFYSMFRVKAVYIIPPEVDNVPSSEAIVKLLANWLDIAFHDKFSTLKERLLSSDSPVLRQHHTLMVQTNIDPTMDNPYAGMSSGASSDSKAFSIWIGLVCAIAAASIMALLFMIRVRHKAEDGSFPRVPESSFPTAVLDASDRYLQQHRPDLFDVIRKASPGVNLMHHANDKDDIPSQEDLTVSTVTEIEGHVPWWNRLTGMFRTHPPLECEKDPAEYPFVFSDFPRHDGTPCLIYRETSLSTSVEAVNEDEFQQALALTDQEFQEALAQHHASLYDDAQEVAYDFREIEPDFKSRLEQLVDMRRRHYERQCILEKAAERKRRQQEAAMSRQQAEARQRELKLKRHEMELDIGEIEATLTPRASSITNLVQERRPSHRVIVSDSDFFSSSELFEPDHNFDVLDHANRLVRASSSQSLIIVDEGEGYGGIPRPPTRNSHRSDSPKSVKREETPKRHRRNRHRRSFSHGTNMSDEKKTTDSNNADDVLMFGIAAYTNFV